MRAGLIFLAAFLFAQSTVAQANGSATLTINLGAERKFVFPNALPALVTATEVRSGNDRYADIVFSNQFEKEHEYVQVHLRILPAGKGKFVVGASGKQGNELQIEIIYQKQKPDGEILKESNLASNSGQNGETGFATIAQYAAVGTDVVGTFEARLTGLTENGSITGPYPVSGTFKVKLTKE